MPGSALPYQRQREPGGSDGTHATEPEWHGELPDRDGDAPDEPGEMSERNERENKNDKTGR
jgi:hypothetical protein